MKRIFSFIMCAVILVTVLCQQAGALPADGPMIVVGNARCEAGESVTVNIDIINNPGIMYLEITPKLDGALGTPTVKNGGIFSSIETGRQYVLTSSKNSAANGTIFTVTFDLPENMNPDTYDISFIFRAAYNNSEDFVTFTVVPGTLICYERTYGDLNGDTQVTSIDANILIKAIAGSLLLNSKEAKAADVNGDGYVTSIDANLMTKYISGTIIFFPGKAPYWCE